MTNRALFLAGAAIAAFHIPPAFAEDTVETAEQRAGDTESSPGKDIIVTARRRSETAQDIPIAVTVLGGQQMDTRKNSSL